MNVLSLFAGIGGLELGLERAGMTTVGQVECDPYCLQVLTRHWPEVPRHDDVTTTVEWWRRGTRPGVDVVCGGFPCQPVSSAGSKLAQADARWLWPAMAEVVDRVRPRWVIGENVLGLLHRGIADVVDDLGAIGYRARVGTVSACSVGAPHARQRVFILAHAEGVGFHGGRAGRDQPGRSGEAEPAREQGRGASPERPTWWETEPVMARMANGVPRGVDRRRALGNAVVPQVAERIGRLVMDSDRSEVAA